eukprot:1159488-Pelagomonas_calceolata.AAC.13
MGEQGSGASLTPVRSLIGVDARGSESSLFRTLSQDVVGRGESPLVRTRSQAMAGGAGIGISHESLLTTDAVGLCGNFEMLSSRKLHPLHAFDLVRAWDTKVLLICLLLVWPPKKRSFPGPSSAECKTGPFWICAFALPSFCCVDGHGQANLVCLIL